MKLQFNKNYFIIAIILFMVEVCIAIFLKTGFIRHTFGDYLVVILLYASIKSVTNLNVWTTAIITLIIAFAVELLQLTPFLEYINLGENKLAKIVFGTSFQFTDLIAYTLGIITILHIETRYHEKT